MPDTFTLTQKLVEISLRDFPCHPFDALVDKRCLSHLLGEYAAMSQLFPYIQAKAIGDVAIQTVKQGQSIDDSIEITAAVGAFLVSDETGVNYVLHTMGYSQLPHILRTKEYFHSRLLEDDIKALMGQEISPHYSTVTVDYLSNLCTDLSDLNHVTRCAAMIAFELHAERMILSLWESIANCCDVDKDTLLYFKTHVGGGSRTAGSKALFLLLAQIVTDL